MIECKFDKDGNIIGVVEYMLFDDDGRFDDDGETMVIIELVIARNHRRSKIISEFITKLLDKYPHAERCTWIREYKYPDRKPKIYFREQLEKVKGG